MKDAFVIAAVMVMLAVTTHSKAVVFEVGFDESVRKEEATGRVVVYLVKEGSLVGKVKEPAGEYFFEDPQPIYGADVTGLKAGEVAKVEEGFPGKAADLPAGKYRAQAVLDMKRESGNFREEAGNLVSEPVEFDAADAVVKIRLTKVIEEKKVEERKGVEVVEVRSELLSKFRGKDVKVRAGVVWPLDYVEGRKYPAVYSVPGFGGNHRGAFSKAEQISKMTKEEQEMYRNVFWIVLDPDGPNGHTLFTDSEVNGPCGRALVEELVPALERKLLLISEAGARVVRGHSSGGWAVVWLAVRYPEVFGACWAYSPDPIDFHRLERVDIYSPGNVYMDRDSREGHVFDTPSERRGGKTICTARIENAMDEAVGPGNTSAGQWDSWQAAWGRRDAKGNPAELFNAKTGKIYEDEASFYRGHDIGEMLRQEPERVGQIFQRRIRLITGEMDDYYLNEAVEYVKGTLEGLNVQTPAGERKGYIKVIPGAGHGTVMQSAEAKGFEREVMEYLRGAGLVK